MPESSPKVEILWTGTVFRGDKHAMMLTSDLPMMQLDTWDK